MPYRLTKTFKLDMGHRTWSKDLRTGRAKDLYCGTLAPNKCGNIHGHSIIISITLESNTLDEQCCVIDTDLFKTAYLKVIAEVDHAFIIDKNDPLFDDFKKIAAKENLRLYVVDFSPSFEALAEHFHNCMKKIIENTPLKDQIKVVETVVTGAEMSFEAKYVEQ